MSERITLASLQVRVENVNRRLGNSGRFVSIEGRNGYTALDEYQWEAGTLQEDMILSLPRPVCIRNITVGTKREVADFLHAMMVGIDLSRAS